MKILIQSKDQPTPIQFDGMLEIHVMHENGITPGHIRISTGVLVAAVKDYIQKMDQVVIMAKLIGEDLNKE